MDLSLFQKEWMNARDLITQGRFNDACQILKRNVTSYRNIELWIDYVQVCLRLKDYDQALEWIRKIQSFYPHDVRVFALKARLSYLLGYYGEALKLYRELIALEPQNLSALLGAAYSACCLRQFELAVAFFQSTEKLISIYPTQWLQNYAIALLFSKDLPRSRHYFEKINPLDPLIIQDSEFWFHYALVCDQLGDDGQAQKLYEYVISFDRNHIKSLHNLGIILHRRQKYEESLRCWEKIILIEPQNVFAQTLIAAYQSQLMSQLPTAFVQALFDQYSFNYEEHLKKSLKYDAPAIARSFLFQADPEIQPGVIYDLGCGTGLMGLVMQDMATMLVGVDCSEGMLYQAKKRFIYHQYIESDLLDWLRIDLSWAADIVTMIEVTNYLGADLNEVIDRILSRLKAGGWLVLTAEAHHHDLAHVRCHPSARYSFHPDFFHQFCSHHPLVDRYTLNQAPLRMHSQGVQEGLYVCIKKKNIEKQ